MRFPLVGGPCDGTQSINFTVRPPVGYQVLCQTHEYTFGADGSFHDAGVAPILGGGASGPLPGERQVGSAWHRLNKTLGYDLPRSLAKATALKRRQRRVVR